MTRFSAPVQPKAGQARTTNIAGGQAFDQPPKLELASLVLTSMVQDNYYESADSQLTRLAALAEGLAGNDELLFAAKAAVYSRKAHGLRSISHALAGEVAYLRSRFPAQRGEWGVPFFEAVVDRLDDAAEIAGYWITKYAGGKKKTLPAAMKRGFARKLEKAKGHLLSKWNGRSTRSLTLRQLAHLVHPKGAEDSPIYKLRGGALEAADTHEVAMTRAGKANNSEEAKAQEWARLFSEGKVKYLAAMRNARRIVEQAPGAVPALIAKLTSLDDIKGSKVFPFQILTAYDAVAELNGPLAKDVMGALSEAIDLSVCNVPQLEGATLVCLDDSGSMTAAVPMTVGGGRGTVRATRPALELAVLFAAIMVKANRDCDLMLFSHTARYRTVEVRGSVASIASGIVKNTVAQGTNFNAPFEVANRAYDRIIMLSDMQGWMGEQPSGAYGQYCARHGVRPKVFGWDLRGLGTSQFRAGA
ncbi:MAG TPA: TROVE domain-containing protein, partial [Anaerolineae bacterium]|nr:TROVE domain-containing protein [Anaerolineae bacterium]